MFIQVGGYTTYRDNLHLADIDDEDAELVGKYKWTPRKDYNTTYAVSHGLPYVLLHRLIMGLERGDKRQVNHINGDGLDNRRCNLEICDILHNSQSFRRPNSSLNVGYVRIRQKNIFRPYEATIILNKKRHSKCFATETEARGWINTLVEEEKQKIR